jgi:hypothetical protein
MENTEIQKKIFDFFAKEDTLYQNNDFSHILSLDPENNIFDKLINLTITTK